MGFASAQRILRALIFKHPDKPGKVTVPHPKRDLHPKTVRSVYRQAGLKEPR